MKPIDGQQQNDFEQILDDRYKRKALIISSQLPVSDWHALFRNELIADASRNGVRIDQTATSDILISRAVVQI